MSRLVQLSRLGARINFFIIHTNFSVFVDNGFFYRKSGAWGRSPHLPPSNAASAPD